MEFPFSELWGRAGSRDSNAMPRQDQTHLWTLSDLCTPWCVRVVATLRIADFMAAGVETIDALAAAAGADAASLKRVLRHLAGVGIFEEVAPDRFALNDAARELLDEPSRLRLDLEAFGGRMAVAWSSLLSAVRTGSPAYHEVFGRPFWDDLVAHPEIAASFDRLMGPAGHGDPDPEVLLDGDWAAVRTVVDIGGGTGALLAAILRARPHVRGTLVDQPVTVDRAAATFEAAGVTDRIMLAAQSFFDPLPAGADLYLLKSVLADWPDREAIAILSRAADAARPDGRVIIVNGVRPDEDHGPPPEILMMVLVGGQERSLTDFRRLAEAAGLRVCAAERGPIGGFLVECRPAAPAIR